VVVYTSRSSLELLPENTTVYRDLGSSEVDCSEVKVQTGTAMRRKGRFMNICIQFNTLISNPHMVCLARASG
jgi:hypothetical protein